MISWALVNQLNNWATNILHQKPMIKKMWWAILCVIMSSHENKFKVLSDFKAKMAVGDIYCHHCEICTYHLSAAFILLGYTFLQILVLSFSSLKSGYYGFIEFYTTFWRQLFSGLTKRKADNWFGAFYPGTKGVGRANVLLQDWITTKAEIVLHQLPF